MQIAGWQSSFRATWRFQPKAQSSLMPSTSRIDTLLKYTMLDITVC
jgi:hypothetical protein